MILLRQALCDKAILDFGTSCRPENNFTSLYKFFYPLLSVSSTFYDNHASLLVTVANISLLYNRTNKYSYWE